MSYSDGFEDEASPHRRSSGGAGWIGFGVLAVIVFLFLLWLWPVTSIGAGNVGVVTTFGKVKDGTLEPGIHLVNPFSSVHKINVQTETIIYDSDRKDDVDGADLTAASKDLQDVFVKVTANYHILPTEVKPIYVQYKSNEYFEKNLLQPIVQEAVKTVTAQYTAEELVTKRAEVSDRMSALVKERFAQTPTVLESTRITNINFSPEFTKAIERKATAVQDAEASKNKLVQVQFEAQQQVEKAKAEAETIKIQAEAINSQGGADYVQLQAIAKWNGVLPGQMIPGSALPFLNLSK